MMSLVMHTIYLIMIFLMIIFNCVMQFRDYNIYKQFCFLNEKRDKSDYVKLIIYVAHLRDIRGTDHIVDKLNCLKGAQS